MLLKTQCCGKIANNANGDREGSARSPVRATTLSQESDNMARKQQKRHNRGSYRRKTAHAHRSTRHMQPVRTQKTVRRRLPEAEVRRRQRARRRQFALLGLAVLLIVLIFAFRHLISTPQQSGADGDTGNSGTSATEEVKQVAKAVNVYQSVMYYQPVVQKYAEQNGYELNITDTRYHHEIYLSDPRKCEPAKLKTVVRHPIKRGCYGE